jgi:hypothetical protein
VDANSATRTKITPILAGVIRLLLKSSMALSPPELGQGYRPLAWAR